MTIIFFDASNKKIYIATEHEKTKILNTEDPNIMDYIPNDDILYVQHGHMITKKQFYAWLTHEHDFTEDVYEELNTKNRFKDFVLDERDEKLISSNHNTHKQYIHPVKNGTILITDIPAIHKIPDNKIELNGKYSFLCLDDLGFDLFEVSQQAKFLLNSKRIEIVNNDHVEKNKQNNLKSESASDAALKKILVPSHIKVSDYMDNTNFQSNDNVIEIDVET